ncbi:hypothetical protein N7456_005643 [Penicillium angulare]|uniref:Uncharacterized protein n=1 Tax=Penicillium angulare TaxID=116970 RepID=A0A9W9FYT0_9EURO|nr:hypothetical protein N7456_005643 [Penicillium angulare]
MSANSEPARWFKENLDEAQRDGRNVIVVMNGFDGLTTDVIAFVKLFQEHAERVRLRVFADEPRFFYEVDVQGVLDVFNGEIEPEQLDDSTFLFVDMFRQLGALEHSRYQEEHRCPESLPECHICTAKRLFRSLSLS